jgi:hypothetical protein
VQPENDATPISVLSPVLRPIRVRLGVKSARSTGHPAMHCANLLGQRWPETPVIRGALLLPWEWWTCGRRPDICVSSFRAPRLRPSSTQQGTDSVPAPSVRRGSMHPRTVLAVWGACDLSRCQCHKGEGMRTDMVAKMKMRWAVGRTRSKNHL